MKAHHSRQPLSSSSRQPSPLSLQSRYPADFHSKRFKVQKAKKILQPRPCGRHDVGWWQFAPLSTLTSTSLSLTSPSILPPSPIRLPQQELLDYPDEEVVIFRHDFGSGVYQALIVFDFASSTTSLDTKILVLAELHAKTAPVTDPLRKKECSEGQPKKNNSNTFQKVPRSGITQLPGAVCSFAEYGHPEESKVHIQSSCDDLRKKALEMPRRTTRISLFFSLFTTCLGIDAHWPKTFASEMLENIQDRYVAESANDFKSIYRLGPNGPWKTASDSSITSAQTDHGRPYHSLSLTSLLSTDFVLTISVISIRYQSNRLFNLCAMLLFSADSQKNL